MAFGSENKILSPVLIFALIIRSAALLSQQQEYRMETIPLTGMFSDFSGTCIQKDSDGFMWFGSTNGLYRYDGTHLKVFRHIPHDTTSLSADHILCLKEDSEGRLWVGTRKGMNCFDKVTETFRCYINNTGTPQRIRERDIVDGERIIFNVNRNRIDNIVEDREGNLWLANYRGVSKFDRATGTYTKNYEISADTNTNNTQPLRPWFIDYIDGQDLLIADFEGCTYRYHKDTDHFEMIEDPGVVLYEYQTGKYMLDRTGAVWYYNKLSPNPEDDKFIIWPRVITRDGSGNIWIRMMDGVYCYREDLNLKFVWKYPEPYTSTPDYNQISSVLYVDNEDIVWFFTHNGIHKIIENYRNFRVYDSDPSNNSFVECIYPESKDLIWFGAMNGIYSLDSRSGTFTLHHGVPWDDSRHPNYVEYMFSDKSGTLWIGMNYEGLFSLVRSDEPPCQFKRHSAPDTRSLYFPSSPDRILRPIFEDSQARLWVGSAGGLYIFNRQENRFITVDLKPAGIEESKFTVHVRHETGSNDLVATGLSGVYVIKPPLNVISGTKQEALNVYQCRQTGTDGKKRAFPFLQTSFMDSRGNLWLGSEQCGLIQINDFERQLENGFDFITVNYTTADGLPSNCIYSLIEDDHGDLWMGTENGLSKFDTESKYFTNYSVRHGLPINLFRTESVAKGMDGELFFGTRKGMVAFHPDSMRINRIVPGVVLTSFQLFNQTVVPGDQSVLKRSITHADRIDLTYKQNSLSFGFASLNYIQPELNQYRYYLEGYESDWIYSGNRSMASYTNLKPGNYVFRASGSNNDGIWNEEGTSVQISIHPPPWLTWYAYLIYILLAGGIAFWIYRYIINRSRMRLALEVERIEKQKVLEIDQMKSRFFANISHEFRTPLTLILGPLQKTDNPESGKISFSRDLVSAMRRNAGRLLLLINQILDISKLETGKMRLQVAEGDLVEFLKPIINSFLSLAESRQIRYTFTLPETGTRVFFDGDKLEKILTNLISNAIKFTPSGGEVALAIRYEPQDDNSAMRSVYIEVADTGKGIPSEYLEHIFDRFYQVNDSESREEEGTGIGLALTKELVDLYHGEITVESEPGKGSTFRVKLPVSKTQFREDEITVAAEIIETGVNKSSQKERFGQDDYNEYTGSESEESEEMEESYIDKGSPVILVVEDNPDLRKYISGNLKKSYRVKTAENGKEGAAWAIEHIPDLVISDVMMPVMDGIEMCRQLKADERTSHIPVIMLTARADRDSKLEGLNTGADNYLIKPFDVEELQLRVRNMMDHQEKMRENFRREFLTEEQDAPVRSVDPLLEKIMQIIDDHLAEAEFNLQQLADDLNMSRTQMFRKVSSVAGTTPNELLRMIRMKRAASLMLSGEYNITQVMYQVGFQNPSHFSRSFKKYYGVNPSDYRTGN